MKVRSYLFYSLSLSLLFLVSCSHLSSSPEVPLRRGVSFSLRPPADYLGPQHLEQRVTIIHDEKKYQFSAVVECDSTLLTVVALAPMGTRVFALRWDGMTLWQDRERIKDFPFDLRYLLVDLQLALFPEESIKKGFTENVAVSSAHNSRTITIENSPFVQVGYQAGKPWEGKVVFQNLLRGYQMELITVESYAGANWRE